MIFDIHINDLYDDVLMTRIIKSNVFDLKEK